MVDSVLSIKIIRPDEILYTNFKGQKLLVELLSDSGEKCSSNIFELPPGSEKNLDQTVLVYFS